MVMIMLKQYRFRRFVSVLLVMLFVALTIVPTALPVSAANKRFITELRVEAGEDAVAKLEEEGWSVTMVGLNLTLDPASQVYLAYKMNTGSPITNVIVSPDVGDSYTDKNGVVYHCVSHVDVNEGIGGGAGCLYATHDTQVGEPLVGIDVLRGNKEKGETLYPITNDGAQIVRTRDGAPADCESGSGSDAIYLAQIRDNIVRPYISEIGVITDSDKWNAVYTACERGYDYYVDGDIDESADTYTIIGYERTADPAQAVTNITAVTAATVQALEDGQIVDDSTNQSGQVSTAAVTISGAEYVRISSQPINAEEPFYIYRTKDSKAGNPISMLYAEKIEQKLNFLFGTWASGYFFSPGVTTAYTYCMNEDLYATLWGDQTVCTKLPVQLLDSFAPSSARVEPTAAETAAPEPVATEPVPDEQVVSQEQENAENAANSADGEAPEENAEKASENPDEEAPQENAEETPQNGGEENPDTVQEEPAAEEPAAEATEPAKAFKSINLAMLTPRDGLPAAAANLVGMRGDPQTPYIERTERSERVNKYQASVFGKGGGIALILGGVVIIAVAVYLIIRKKRSAEKTEEKSNKNNKPIQTKKQNKAKKSKQQKKHSKLKKTDQPKKSR